MFLNTPSDRGPARAAADRGRIEYEIRSHFYGKTESSKELPEAA